MFQNMQQREKILLIVGVLIAVITLAASYVLIEMLFIGSG